MQAFGSFVKSTTDNGIENKATNSGGVLGSYRYFFNTHNGVEANYGYSLNTQSYSLTSGALGVNSNVYPSGAVLAAASVPIMPLAPPRFSTTNCWPNAWLSLSAHGRPIASVAPPGA